MKLSKIASILNDNLEALTTTTKSAKNIDSSKGLIHVYNLDRYREAINNIAETNLFCEQIQQLQELPIFNNAFPQFTLSSEQFQKMSMVTAHLYSAGTLLIDAIYNALPEYSDTIVAVKLPEFQTFQDFIKILEKLEQAFSLAVMNPVVDGSVIIDSLEPGSKWINIEINSEAAVKLIGALVWAGCVISTQMHSNAQMEEALRAKRLQNDALEYVVDANKAQIDMMLHSEAQHIYNEQFEGDPEQEGRLRQSIKMFSEIIYMGGEIQPTLNAANSIRESFPDKAPQLVESRIKLLQQNN